MSKHKTDNWFIENVHNTARFFTENRQIAWVALVATVLWGIYGYLNMPQRKDPDLPSKSALAMCYWPGVSTEKVEQLITRKIEEKIAENVNVKLIKSTTRVGVTFVFVDIQEYIASEDVAKEFDDIKLRLDQINDLPDGASKIIFVKDFGSTAALMLTIASPKIGDVQISLRAKSIRDELQKIRNGNNDDRISIIHNFPESVNPKELKDAYYSFINLGEKERMFRNASLVEGYGFVGMDASTENDDKKISEYWNHFLKEHLRSAELHPDAWQAVIIRNLDDVETKLTEATGDKYTYRELEDYADEIKRTFQTIDEVSKIDIAGNLDEKVFLTYSQERLASYGIKLSQIRDILAARNTPISGGMIEANGKNLAIVPSGEFKNEKEIGDVIISQSKNGVPLYLRDLFEVNRSYESPAKYLNYYTWKDSLGNWNRSRSVTLAVQMRTGKQIGVFGDNIDQALDKVKEQLPPDLIFARTSDQPLQVKESVDLFMSSLYEAVILVVLVALIGFWEWRSALLLALSIPLTLAMTFGMMYVLGIDLQQISIASLIIALGLLVDDPVVAGDAIKRDLAIGHKSLIASWLGPTKLATAILFATITNIVAYLPFLLISGDTGRFIFSMPVVLACSLIASRIVSMTFIPLLGYYILRPGKRPHVPIKERRNKGFAGWYYKVGSWAIENRWKVAIGSLGIIVLGVVLGTQLRTEFFPKDLSYFSYVEVWMPEDASTSATGELTKVVEDIVRKTAEDYAKEHSDGETPREVLKSLTTFVGGSGPRFWTTLVPEPKQQNYAQVIIRVHDKHDTQHLVEKLQVVISEKISGARINARELEIGPPVGIPVSIRISGDDIKILKQEAEKLKEIFRSITIAERVQDDWGAESFAVNFEINPDKANLSGVTNLDVAISTAVALNGFQVDELREGDKQIPILARLNMNERAQLSDLQNLYVISSAGPQKIPLQQIADIKYSMQTEKLQRRSQFRTITVSCFPVVGSLASEVLNEALDQIGEVEKNLPTGYKLEIGGEKKEQDDSFGDLVMVLLISISMIFIALVIQFRNSIKPLLVFAAIPYGVVGAIAALLLMGANFGFMAFLGIISLVGVIVSHVIVLFDFIEEEHQKGEPLIEALLDAGIVRLRPVLITVGATVFALFPLASHGGPLWEPLCYAQIGGLTFATFITLLLVPVFYAIFVLDLKIVKWDTKENENEK